MDNLQAAAPDQLPVLAITLLKGVLYREADERLWASLLNLQSQLRLYGGTAPGAGTR
jgi:hypothetical protein